MLAPMLALSGCGEGKYPSLAQRPAERAARAPVPATTAVPAVSADADPVSPALAAQLATLLDTAREAHKGFLARREATEHLVTAARNAAVPSDAWAAANEALAELDSSRTALAVAQDKLERLSIEDREAHAIADGAAADSPAPGPARAPARPVARAIAATRDEVLAMAGDEDTVLSDLKDRMPG